MVWTAHITTYRNVHNFSNFPELNQTADTSRQKHKVRRFIVNKIEENHLKRNQKRTNDCVIFDNSYQIL